MVTLEVTQKTEELNGGKEMGKDFWVLCSIEPGSREYTF